MVVTLYKQRKAVAMIELIFAIVIMGIVMLSAPLMLSTANKSVYVGVQQESIATVATEIGMILTHHWDEANTDLNFTAPILRTKGNPDLNETTNAAGFATGFRAGTPSGEYERTFLTSLGGRLTATNPSTTNFTAEGDFDDIDDYDGHESELTLIATADMSEGDYLDQDIKITSTVTYISDTPDSGTYLGSATTLTFNDPFGALAEGNSTNIKRVSVTLTTDSTMEDLNKTILLRAFSCNIGTYSLNTRSF